MPGFQRIELYARPIRFCFFCSVKKNIIFALLFDNLKKEKFLFKLLFVNKFYSFNGGRLSVSIAWDVRKLLLERTFTAFVMTVRI